MEAARSVGTETRRGRTVSDEHALRAATQLPPARQSPRAARRFIAEMLARWRFESVSEPAQLLTSELVTNAVLHAGTDVQIVLEARDCTVHVEVIDLTKRPPVTRYTPFDDLQTGRGLTLLDSMASAWGVSPLDTGKSVWFELDAARPAEPPVRPV
jgi:anti-sigma regulatory factor (Ser/Thr protein kinase)